VHAGIISDIDLKAGVGLIESDEGEIILFNRDALPPDCTPHALRVGQRVEFTIEKLEPAPRAGRLIVGRHH
jgi:cold shock CspA family protein